jgi:uncharacterized membrane protein
MLTMAAQTNRERALGTAARAAIIETDFLLKLSLRFFMQQLAAVLARWVSTGNGPLGGRCTARDIIVR